MIVSSKFQTKEWRKYQSWYKKGKYNECETFQKQVIKKITNIDIINTNERLNMDDIYIGVKGNSKIDCFSWSENFDMKQEINDKTLFYYNLKMVCSEGGFQKRTLKDVYNFIKHQLLFLIKNYNSKIYFINILDGKYCQEYMECFKRLTDKKEYRRIRSRLFIGDLLSFESWFKKYKLNHS